jgi:hypothetical protein
VLVDLEFEDAEVLTAKASLALRFNDLVDKRSLFKPKSLRSRA